MVWREVKEYEKLYEVSDTGLVRSMDRISTNRSGKYLRKGRILKPATNKKTSYLHVSLCENGKQTSKHIHQLVAECFLGHISTGHLLVVDHIDEDKTNNHATNLRIISNRLNISRGFKNKSSKYVGVYWDKRNEKWQSRAKVGRVLKCFGRYNTELEAHEARQKGLAA